MIRPTEIINKLFLITIYYLIQNILSWLEAHTTKANRECILKNFKTDITETNFKIGKLRIIHNGKTTTKCTF